MNKFERTQPLVSILIPSFFEKSQDGKYGENETFWFAQECLKKLLERTIKEDYELIIIDNGSTLDLAHEDVKDHELTTDEYWQSADILIRNKTNLGFAPSCNQSFNLARGKYIVCLNNDVIVYDGWLDALLNVFDKELAPPVGVVMPALMKETKDAREALKMKEISLKDNYGKYSHGAEFGSLWVMKKELMDKVRELNKKELGQDVVFDENFKLGMGEDRKLWNQVRLLGFDTYRCHETRVYHQGNMTISKIPNRKEYTEKNREYLKEWREKHNISTTKKAVPST